MFAVKADTQQWVANAIDHSTMRLQRRSVQAEVIPIINQLFSSPSPGNEEQRRHTLPIPVGVMSVSAQETCPKGLDSVRPI